MLYFLSEIIVLLYKRIPGILRNEVLCYLQLNFKWASKCVHIHTQTQHTHTHTHMKQIQQNLNTEEPLKSIVVFLLLFLQLFCHISKFSKYKGEEKRFSEHLDVHNYSLDTH